jgi:hypothetical protein
MSEVITDKLTGKTSAGDVTITSEGGSATMQLQQGVAKAWLNFDNNGTATLNDSYAITSCTDTATGRFRTNFTNNMSNSLYSAAGMQDGYTLTSDTNDDKTSTGEAHLSFYASGTGGQRTNFDADRNTVSYHGDLA